MTVYKTLLSCASCLNIETIIINFESETINTDFEGNENRFLYSISEFYEEGPVRCIFRVRPDDLKATDWYEFAVNQIDNSTGKVTVMENRNIIQYRGECITEKLINESSKVLRITINSSTNIPSTKSLATEWRTEPATKI